MSKYLKLLNCSIKVHRCIKAIEVISAAATSLLSVCTLIKAYSKVCK